MLLHLKYQTTDEPMPINRFRTIVDMLGAQIHVSLIEVIRYCTAKSQDSKTVD